MAHRNDLDITSNKINFVKAQAELLSVAFQFSNGKNSVFLHSIEWAILEMITSANLLTTLNF